MSFDANRCADELLGFVDLIAKRLGWLDRFAARETSVLEHDAQDKPIALTLSFNTIGIGIDVGVPVPTNQLGTKTTVPGYRVWEVRSKPATRWQPEDAWDVDLLLTASPTDALDMLFKSVVSVALADAMVEGLPATEPATA